MIILLLPIMILNFIQCHTIHYYIYNILSLVLLFAWKIIKERTHFLHIINHHYSPCVIMYISGKEHIKFPLQQEIHSGMSPELNTE